jgi:hypothetical protein
VRCRVSLLKFVAVSQHDEFTRCPSAHEFIISCGKRGRRKPVWTFRRIFWFEKGERREIAAKVAALKWNDSKGETIGTVLSALALGLPFAFFTSWVVGLVYLWGIKEAIQALNMRGFFD